VGIGIAKRDDFKRRSKLTRFMAHGLYSGLRNGPQPARSSTRASALRGRRPRFYLAIRPQFGPSLLKHIS
jgi:hypothetical protein